MRTLFFSLLIACAGLPAWAGNDLQNNGDGTLSESSANLMWQALDDGIERTWDDAGTYCDTLELAGHADWRLPSVEELKNALANPAAVAEPGISAEHAFWSGTAGLDTRQNPDLARMLHEYGMGDDFERKYAWRASAGDHTSAPKRSIYRVLCVR